MPKDILMHLLLLSDVWLDNVKFLRHYILWYTIGNSLMSLITSHIVGWRAALCGSQRFNLRRSCRRALDLKGKGFNNRCYCIRKPFFDRYYCIKSFFHLKIWKNASKSQFCATIIHRFWKRLFQTKDLRHPNVIYARYSWWRQFCDRLNAYM